MNTELPPLRGIHNSVRNLLSLADCPAWPGIFPVDFVFTHPVHGKVGLEVKLGRLQAADLLRLENRLKVAEFTLDFFVLLTDADLGWLEKLRFDDLLKNEVKGKAVCKLGDLSSFLGFSRTVNLAEASVRTSLDRLAVQKVLKGRAHDEPLHLTIAPGESTDRLFTNHNIPLDYFSLARQFSAAAVKELYETGAPLQRCLHIGEPTKNCIVVLSDVKNFSTMVRLAEADMLRDVMAKYYRLVRDLVWSHGGVLDKFIGDAVLAVFNYPHDRSGGADSALAFAIDLIQAGDAILGAATEELNEIVETGTRIGIAQGELWALDIGQSTIEVSFIGNTINLAARLEKHCAVNGVLIDQRTIGVLAKAQSKLLPKLNPVQVVLDASDVKGQLASMRAWQCRSPAQSAAAHSA